MHCFEYGRAIANQLNEICESVNYYKRKQGFHYMASSFPYIAVTRSSEEMMQNLLKDDYPILFEGLHCCYHITDKRLVNRKKIVRTHNIEHEYYGNLAKAEQNIIKKRYFSMEARKLKRFENVLNKADAVLAISPSDKNYLSKKFKNVMLLPAFHPDENVRPSAGRGYFAFYHGNLEIAENYQAAMFLINEVFNDLPIPLIIAGKNPPTKMQEAARPFNNITIKANITTEEIYILVKDAQMNVLPTFQSTGIKLKLLTSLFNGRFCIVNNQMVNGTGLESLCIICPTAEEMKKEIVHHFDLSFGSQNISKREQILMNTFSNRENAKKILNLIKG